MFSNVLHLEQGCVNPWSQVAGKIRFCMVGNNLYRQTMEFAARHYSGTMNFGMASEFLKYVGLLAYSTLTKIT